MVSVVTRSGKDRYGTARLHSTALHTSRHRKLYTVVSFLSVTYTTAVLVLLMARMVVCTNFLNTHTHLFKTDCL